MTSPSANPDVSRRLQQLNEALTPIDELTLADHLNARYVRTHFGSPTSE